MHVVFDYIIVTRLVRTGNFDIFYLAWTIFARFPLRIRSDGKLKFTWNVVGIVSLLIHSPLNFNRLIKSGF